MKSRLVIQRATLHALFAALVAVAFPSALHAQEATLAALLAEADSANPEIAAAHRAAEAAAARLPSGWATA